MEKMDTKQIVELILGAAILVGPIIVIIERLIGDRGLGARAIQFAAVVMLIPAIVLLALEKIIDAPTVGTLIGGLSGYLLSSIGEYRADPKRKSDDEPVPRR
jgi:4-amino-4-deoxy-L-arabinose transferase-like glycosyltransferase